MMKRNLEVALDVDGVIQSHLKRRNYPSESHCKLKGRSRRWTVTLPELVVSMASESTLATHGLVSFRVKSSSELLSQVDTSFEHFLELIRSHDGDHGSGATGACLERLAFPLFAHYFTQLFTNGHKAAAKDFFSKFSDRIRELDFPVDDLEAISRSVSSQTLDVRLRLLSSSRTVISLPSEDLRLLMVHLENSKDLLLHQIINERLTIRTPTRTLNGPSKLSQNNNCVALSTVSSPDASNSANYDSPPPSYANHVNNVHRARLNNDAQSRLQPSSSKVKSEKNSSPSTSKSASPSSRVCVCSIDRQAVCGAIDQKWDIAAYGFETSEIQLIALDSDCDFRTDQREHDSRKVLTFELPQLAKSSSELFARHQTSEEMQLNASHSATLRGHSGPVYSLAFIPDSSLLLSCSGDTTIRTWDTERQCQVAVYSGHNYPVWSVAASALGLYFASGSRDATARLWTLDRSYPLRIFTGHTQDVDAVQFHPNTKYLATGSVDSSVRLWNVSDGRMVRVFSGHQAGVRALAFSPDGRMLASSGDDRRIKVWDIGSAGLIKELSGHEDAVHELKFSADSRLLASCSMDKTLKLWDVTRDGGDRVQAETNNNVNGISTKDAKNTPSDALASHTYGRQLFMNSQFNEHNYLMALSASSGPS